jgi:ferredoxin
MDFLEAVTLTQNAEGEVVAKSRRCGDFLPQVDSSRCTGCGWCVAACPLHLLSLERIGWKKSAVVHDSAACTGCKKCEFKCLFKVITVERHRPTPEAHP